MRRLNLCLLALGAGLTAGCSSERSDILEAHGALASDWMNNPDNGNLRIVRFEEEFAVSWSDASNGLRATHSTFPLGPDCGPQEELDPLNQQIVGTIDPDDFFASWLRWHAKGSVWVTVRDLTQPGDCFGNRLVAEGWGELINTDNDLFGLAPGDKNANAWGAMATGTLTAVDGSLFRYEGHFRAKSSLRTGGKLLSAVVNVH